MEILAICIVVALLISTYAAMSFAPWVPTRKKDAQRIAKVIGTAKNKNIYELGSGTGNVASYLAKNTQANITGIEISPPLLLFAKIRNLLERTNITYKLQNLYNTNLQNADIIYLFGTPRAKDKIAQKLIKSTRPGTTVISYAFKLPKLTLIEKNKPTPKDTSIYVYKTPKTLDSKR